MDESAILLSMADRMLWIAALVAAPILIASLAIGLVIGLVQAATSVNEQTLTFVPKLGAVAFVLSLGCFLLAQASLVLPDLWLSHWSSLPPEQQED